MIDKTIDFGPYRIESEPDRLLWGSEETPLRPKGLRLLAYLARRPGHASGSIGPCSFTPSRT